MALSTITDQGFLKSANSFSRREFGFKFKIVGASVASGDGGNPIYSAPDEETKLELMRALTNFTGGSVYPSSGLIDIRAAVPVAGTDSNPRYSMTYEFLINPNDIPSAFDISEIGLFAQDFIETSDWIYSNSYIAGLSYVTHNDKAWVASKNITEISDWNTVVTYLTDARVFYNSKYFEALADNTSVTPVDGLIWKELSAAIDVEPSSQNPDWSEVIADLTESNLIPFGQPYLYYIQVRDVPAVQNNEHVTRWEITISFDEAVSDVFFDEASTVAFTELQLQLIEFITQENIQIRDLSRQYQVLQSDVDDIKEILGL